MPCIWTSILPAEKESHNLTNAIFRNGTAGNSHSAESESVNVLLLFLLLPIIVFAVLGNLLIIASVAHFRHLQTCTNAFIVSLATADFLVAVLVMPFSLARSVDRWRFGKLFCTAHFMLDVVLCTASILNLSCVALDRYLAVCDPLRYAARMSAERVAKLLLVSWLLPVLGFCLLVGVDLCWQSRKGVLRGQGAEVCLPELRAPYATVASILSFFIPMAFMIATYGRIFLEAQRQARQIQAAEAQVGQRHRDWSPSGSRKEGKATRTLGILLGAFLLCWLPFFTVNVGHPFWGCPVSPGVLECVLWLGYANSALNPLLYAFINRAFRRAFAVLLGCGILGRQLQGGRLDAGVSQQTGPELGTVTR
ncbi:trace amine-associated receptor 1-like [Conger conger]|uniref:trace amine-associated receptor 1-like n=1 Tax=Conger conger TaxID=82655 RepID=UPI002A5A4F70|nr:trace amine-associated receptor 1-like [Conger conger]